MIYNLLLIIYDIWLLNNATTYTKDYFKTFSAIECFNVLRYKPFYALLPMVKSLLL